VLGVGDRQGQESLRKVSTSWALLVMTSPQEKKKSKGEVMTRRAQLVDRRKEEIKEEMVFPNEKNDDRMKEIHKEKEINRP